MLYTVSNIIQLYIADWDDIVGIVTTLWVGESGVRLPAGARDLSPECPDWLWGFMILHFSGYQKLIVQGKCGQGVKLTTHFYLMLRLRMSRANSLCLL
jgi:hypothetical protein